MFLYDNRILTSRIAGARNYSKDYDSSDDEKEPKSKENKHKDVKKAEIEPTSVPSKADVDSTEEPAITRLNRLLASMPTENTYLLANKNNNVTLPRPGDAHKKRKEESKQQIESKDIFVAAKRVASLAGDVEQSQRMESELLAKLLGHNKEEKDINKANNIESNDTSSELSLR